MKKEIISIALSFVILALAVTAPVQAESGNSLTISPSTVIMQINDYGKVYEIEITNNTQESMNLKAEEAIVARSAEGKTMPLAEVVTKNFFELSPTEFSVAAGQSQKIKVRTKIINNSETAKFPALLIAPDKKKSDEVALDYALYVPFILQNTGGQLVMNTELAIDVDKFSTNSVTKVSGKIINAGDKFFTPSGSLLVLKDGVKIDEKELTTQIGKALFNGESVDFAIDWQNPDDSIQAVGEYTIETKITNNLTDKTTVSLIKYIYIPMQLVYIAGGAVLVIVLGLAIAGIIKSAKNKKQVYY